MVHSPRLPDIAQGCTPITVRGAIEEKQETSPRCCWSLHHLKATFSLGETPGQVEDSDSDTSWLSDEVLLS